MMVQALAARTVCCPRAAFRRAVSRPTRLFVRAMSAAEQSQQLGKDTPDSVCGPLAAYVWADTARGRRC